MGKIGYIMTHKIEVIKEYREKIEDLIANCNPKDGAVTNIETKIRLKITEPIYQKPNRISPKEKETVRKQVQE